MDIIKRFESKYIVNEETKCWEWTAGVSEGYGVFRYPGGKRAHRFSYEHYNNTKLNSLTIDHLCNNKLCVNPEHLEAVTKGENSRRRNLYEYDYLKMRKSICKNGHNISDNAYVRPDGYIECRTCRSNRVVTYLAKNEQP